MSGPDREAVETAKRALRGAHDVAFVSEGIPMLLALVPAEGRELGVRASAVSEGAELAEELQRTHAVLFGDPRDSDLGAVGGTLMTVAVERFVPRGQA